MSVAGRLCASLMIPFMYSVPASGQELSGIWRVDLGEDRQYGIRFQSDGANGNRLCGILHWLKEPRRSDGSWKLDELNPNPQLRSRRILGLTLLGNLQAQPNNRITGRIYLPDLGSLVPGLPLAGVSCDVTITFATPANPPENRRCVRDRCGLQMSGHRLEVPKHRAATPRGTADRDCRRACAVPISGVACEGSFPALLEDVEVGVP